MKVWILLIAALCALGSNAIDTVSRNETERDTMSVRIVGGTFTPRGYFTWQVSLGYYSSYFCGGSLIASDWVLTAAHCVRGRHPTHIKAGTNDLRVGGYTSSVRRVILHPKYNSRTNENDIALIQLSRPIKNVLPISLPMGRDLGNLEKVGTTAVVSGYGARYERGRSSYILSHTAVPVVDLNTCKNAYKNFGILYDSNICAGYQSGGKDSCQGDSGGPLFKLGRDRQGSDAVQIGVVSWGRGCARANSYGVYARTADFAEWIASTTNSNEISWERTPSMVVGRNSFNTRSSTSSSSGSGTRSKNETVVEPPFPNNTNETVVETPVSNANSTSLGLSNETFTNSTLADSD